MPRAFNTGLLRPLLAVLLLVAGQSLAFAHDIDEAAHPAATVCDLCIASQPLGAAAGGTLALEDLPCAAGTGLLPEFAPPVPSPTYLSPGQRAPPVSV